MPIDESYNLYRCTVCDEVKRHKDEIRDHVLESGKGRHNVSDPNEVGLYYETRAPSTQMYLDVMDQVEEWRSRVRTALQSMAPESRQWPASVAYTKVAERTNVPRSFVTYFLEQKGIKVTRSNGARFPIEKRRTSWYSLTDKNQDTLLALAYFPELTDPELAELPFSGAAGDPQVSRTRNRYLWILFHENTDAPLSDWEPRNVTEEDGLMTEGVNEALGELSNVDEPVADDAEAFIEAMEGDPEEVGSGDSGGEPQGERTEKRDPAEAAEEAVGDLVEELGVDADEEEEEYEHVQTTTISHDLAFSLIRQVDDAGLAWRVFESVVSED